MRTSSRVLGIIGTCLALLYGGLIMLGGIAFLALPFDSGDGFFDEGYDTVAAPPDMAQPIDDPAEMGGIVFLSLAGAVLASGVLGLIGSVLVRKRHAASGVLFIIAALLSLLPGFLIAVLFILAGIFAFVREKPPAAPVLYAPYPPGYPAPYPPGAYPPPPVPHPYPPYGTQAAPPYPYPPYRAQAAPLPPQYPAYGAYPPPAAPPPNADNIKEDP